MLYMRSMANATLVTNAAATMDTLPSNTSWSGPLNTTLLAE